jgi:hypothetical protein
VGADGAGPMADAMAPDGEAAVRRPPTVDFVARGVTGV